MLVIIALAVVVTIGIFGILYKLGKSGPLDVLFMLCTFGGGIILLSISMSLGTTRSMDQDRILERRELAPRFEYMKKGEPMEEIRKAETLIQVRNWNNWLFEAKRGNKTWDVWHPDEVETLGEIK